MYLTIQGIVLRVTDYNDKDALLTMLTRRHGRLTVKARGLRRKNSPLIAPCQLLAYGEFTLFEYRGQYTINEAQSIELFTPLRRDLTKLSLGTYFAQVSEVLSQEDMPNPELQSLLLNCLYALSKLDLPESQVKAVFELRAACLSLRPSSDLEEVELMLNQTTAASDLCTQKGNPVFGDVTDCSASLERADRGGSLQPVELLRIAGILRCARNIKGYVAEDDKATVLDALFQALSPIKYLEDKIFGAILS